MAFEPKIREELSTLCLALQEGNLSPEQTVRLDELVCTNDDAREFFLRYRSLIAELEWQYGNAPHLDKADSMSADPMSLPASGDALPLSKVNDWKQRVFATLTRPTVFSVSTAALVIGLLITALAFIAAPVYRTVVGSNDPDTRSNFVAQLTTVREATWGQGQIGTWEGSQLLLDHQMLLKEGFAEIKYQNGVRVLLEGPCDFRLDSTNGGTLNAGRAVAEVPQDVHGFAISTPAATVMDLGTEFGVEVMDADRTVVTVFQGAIQLVANDGRASSSQRIEAGSTARIEPDHVEIVGMDATPPFTRELSERLIAGVRSSTGNRYLVVTDGLQEDARAYTDELHQWNGLDADGLPQELVGAEYVRTANLDRDQDLYDVMLKISQPARLYVFWTQSRDPPEWLKEDYEKTSLRIGMDAIAGRGHPETPGVGPGESIEIVFDVWRRDINEPRVLHLGPTRRKGTAVIGIAATPLETAKP